jgi:N-acetylglucosaminyldiphosphoundecaprenol N-acetyl-beta-D-mannosaminyltransferase
MNKTLDLIQSKTKTKRYLIIKTQVNATNLEDAAQLICQWGELRQSKYVCLANAYMLMLANDSIMFRQVLNQADLITADGRPLVWILRSLGAIHQDQVCGRDLTGQICKIAMQKSIRVGFYGCTDTVLVRLIANLKNYFPGLIISYAFAPPFRSLTAIEVEQVAADIRNHQVQILFVGLGCPKQEIWMSKLKEKIPAVLIGIGGAFEMLAGTKPSVPCWMQHLGMEWLFRLCLEPRRLFWRNVWFGMRFFLVMLRSLPLIFIRDQWRQLRRQTQ